MEFLTPEEQAAETKGVSILVAGPFGIGKTSLAKTLPAELLPKACFVKVENGTLAIKGLPIALFSLDTWEELRNVAAVIGGPNPALPSNAVYSQAHYDSVINDPAYSRFPHYDVVFIDSLNAGARFSFIYSEQQPESFSHGKKDLRGTFGLHARNMVSFLSQLQRAKSKTIIITCGLGYVVDDYNVGTWQLMTEGARTNRELPGILDQVITMQLVDFGDGKPPARAFVCTSPNPWNYPAKDRSGRLDQIEAPDLGKLLSKLNGNNQGG